MLELHWKCSQKVVLEFQCLYWCHRKQSGLELQFLHCVLEVSKWRSLLVFVDVVIVTSTSIVIKMELVRVTESAVTMEEDMSAELVTEIKLHRKTVGHT